MFCVTALYGLHMCKYLCVCVCVCVCVWEPLVTQCFTVAPSLHDCFTIVARRDVLTSACLSAILSGLVLLIAVT